MPLWYWESRKVVNSLNTLMPSEAAYRQDTL